MANHISDETIEYVGILAKLERRNFSKTGIERRRKRAGKKGYGKYARLH